MNLEKAESMALDLMSLHGLQKEGWVFDWSKSRRAAGTCYYRLKMIALSKPLTELADEADVKDTILHEIAHALTPNHGHDYVWQKKALEIGCNGQRCYGGYGCQKESLVIASNLIAKYKAVCINGHESFCNRMPKRKRSCGLCSRRYDERFILNYVPNV